MTKGISETALLVSESEVKKAVEDRLQFAQNQGQLIFLRLNSGDFIEVRGDTRRRIKGCPAGTADYVVFQGVKHELCFGVTPFDRCKPLPACRVTFIECKSSKGKQSPEQKTFEEEVKKQNCRYFLVRDVDILEEILK